ncbi:MAG: YicC family protein [Ignavibacteriales bacterium]|nr:YicC family protein [Ignavibacteriales bacterium]
MISSMTGYGRGEVSEGKITAVAELRSVNNRYFEVSARLPKTMTLRESEVKEIIRSRFSRGKINVALSITHENASEIPLKVNKTAAKTYYRLLTDIKKSVNLRDKITLNNLLQFQDIIEVSEFEKGDEGEWMLIKKALMIALNEAEGMRRSEGKELMKDLAARIEAIEKTINRIEQLAKENIPVAKANLESRIKELALDQSVIDLKRLEAEFALLVDKLDITEETVRFRSHNKFFLEALRGNEAVGRKLNFLIQEMNREANTIGAKANNSDIAHLVVEIKEELEKIREQLQNIE